MATITGMVKMESRVDKVTRLTDRAMSRPYLVANIVVATAIGALEAMAQAIKRVPRMPQSHMVLRVNVGTTISLNPMDQ